jgi:tetratricopeptide (TPR) repeat protein
MSLYFVSGSPDHLNESLVLLNRAHGLRIGHPARGRICRLFAAATLQKDIHFGQRVDLSLSPLLGLYKESLQWRPLGHHSHFEGWDGLSMVFSMQRRRTGNIHDLNHAITFGRTACMMLNSHHPKAYRLFGNFSITANERYEALGNPADHELAILHARRALDIGPRHRRPTLLLILAKILTTATDYSVEVELFSEVISLAREALDCEQESSKYDALLTLGQSLIVKASHFGDIDDLKEGIHHIRQSLKSVDEGTVYYVHGAMNACDALLQQYEMNPSQHFHALKEATQLLEGLGRQQVPEIYRGDVLYWTAKAYRAQFYHSGHYDILKSACAIDLQALDLRPPGHHRRCMSLAALSEDIVELSVIKEYLGLENAINMLTEALNDVAEGHPDLNKVTLALAKLLLIPNTPYTNYEKGLFQLLHMLQNSPGSAYRCVVDMVPVLRSVESNFASKWIAEASTRKYCLDVYEALINILPRLVSLDMDLARRIQVLSQARDLATKASSHSIALKKFGRAVELLESGRALFWAQHLRLRTSFDSLDHDTAKELRDISRRLEITASPNLPLDLDSNLARARIERIMADRRRLSSRFNELVDHVRSQPGMDQFMSNMDYMALSSAAVRGPIVILQLSWMCVITTPHADPKIIPLHEVTNAWLQGVANILHLVISRSRSRLDERGARKQPLDDHNGTRSSEEYTVLAEIWRRIVQPLLNLLGWKVSSGLLHQEHQQLIYISEMRRPRASTSVSLPDRNVCVLADSCRRALQPERCG